VSSLLGVVDEDDLVEQMQADERHIQSCAIVFA